MFLKLPIQKNEKIVEKYEMTKYRQVRGLYEINVLHNSNDNSTVASFINFGDTNISVNFHNSINPFDDFLITFGNTKFPNEVKLDELKFIGEELIILEEFIQAVKRDFENKYNR